MGGKSAEYDISLQSGQEVVRNLDRAKYNVFPVTVTRDGETWLIGNDHLLVSGDLTQKSMRTKNPKVNSLARAAKLSLIGNHKIDIVFIAMHGPYGEDGTVQGFLELVGIPYTGSGVLASALGMDKISSRKLFTQAGLRAPTFVALKRDKGTTEVLKKFKLSVFVKPNNQGSSVGTTKVNFKKDLKRAIEKARQYSDTVLVDEFIDGVEVTASIIGNKDPKALPLIEIVPKKEFFDYDAKYNESLCDEIVPARITKTLTKRAQQTALLAFKTLGCRGFGRVDMIIKGNDVYVLEVNTIPGLTAVSLLPKASKYVGISYSRLLDKIINLGLEGNDRHI